jgi:hypothetical protein
MRLTNYIRDAFIRSAMQDVPKEDFNEQVAKLLREDSLKKLPPKVRAIAEDKDLRHFVTSKYYHVPSYLISNPKVYDSEYTPSAEAEKKLSALIDQANTQNKRNQDLDGKLRSVAYACTTRKALVEALPEFEKYLPADEAKAVKANLPALANVVSDFVKAGWPKQNQGKIAAAQAAA